MVSPIIVHDKDIKRLLGSTEPTKEHAILSHLISNRDWVGVEQLLDPLKDCQGHQNCLYLVYRHAYFELLSINDRAQERDFVRVLRKLQVLSPCKEDFMSLCSLLTAPSLMSHEQYADWDKFSSRQHLLYELSLFVHKNLHPSLAPPISPTYLHSRLVDLVVRGVLYEQCESVCRERYQLKDSSPGQIINIMALLQNSSDAIFATPPVIHSMLTIPSEDNVSVTSRVNDVTPHGTCINGIVSSENRLPSSTPKHYITHQPTPPTTPIAHQATPILCASHQGIEKEESADPKCVMISCVRDTHPVRCVAFTDDGGKVAIGANSRVLRVLNAQPLATHDARASSTLQLPVIHKVSDHHTSSIYCATWGGGILVTGSNDQTIKLLHHGTIRHGGTVREMCFVSNNRLVAVGSGLQVIDTSRVSVLNQYDTVAQVLSVVPIDSNTVVSGGGCVKIWDIRSHSAAHVITMPHPVTSLTYCHSNLACSTTSGDCHTLSLSTNTTVSRWRPHISECRSIRYSPCGKYLLTSSYDKTVCLTNTSTMQYTTLCCHNNKVIQSRWHPSGSVIATTSADKTASFWRLTYQ